MPSDADPSDLPYPSITPYLFYRDAAAALDWLVEAFGFTERRRITANDGTVAHAEVLVGAEGVVMFGSPGDEYESPDGHAKPAFSLYIRVDDCDRHARRAERAGARIVVRPIDRPWGDREYTATDPEGHRWTFWSRRRRAATGVSAAPTLG